MTTPQILALIGTAAVSYLLGSCNFAIIVSHLLAKDDIRRHGSGNAGMTNILRTYGRLPAVLTALGDFLKAIIAVLLARMLFAYVGGFILDAGYFAGLFVLLGHIFPVYFHFRGGKGVMTSLGVILAVNPIVFIALVVLFVPLVFITRIVSLGSILGAVSFPILTYIVRTLQGRPAFYDTFFAGICTVIIVFMHRDNIRRLLSGTENKFGSKPKK